MRRVYCCVAVAEFAVAVTFVGLCWWSAHDSVRAKLNQIDSGWTQNDVERAMGTPTETFFDEDNLIQTYQGTEGMARIGFSKRTGLVIAKNWTPTERDPFWRHWWRRVTTVQKK